MRRRTWLQQGALGLATAGWNMASAGEATVRVVAASDLKFVLAQLLEVFRQETGIKVEASFGSSGNFARQIRQGLPAHLFMSADEGWVMQLAQAGLTRQLPAGGSDSGVIYAEGHLALYVPKGSTLVLDPGLKGLQAGWVGVHKFAIANPELAPYGRAAREALQQLGLWETVRPKLVLGDNIAQTAQFVATGAAQAGLISLSLAVAPELASQGRHVALPTSLHAPIRQRMVLLKDAPQSAWRLYEFLQTPAAKDVFRRYGFKL